MVIVEHIEYYVHLLIASLQNFDDVISYYNVKYDSDDDKGWPSKVMLINTADWRYIVWTANDTDINMQR